MTDITKCANGCEKQHQCYRWTAQGSEYQSIADFKPDDKGKCEHFWKKERTNAKR